MTAEDLNGLTNTDKISLKCSTCDCIYDRKVRDIKFAIKHDKFRLICLTCAKYEKRGAYKSCLTCNIEYYSTKCNQKSKFCSKSCAAKFNNKRRGKEDILNVTSKDNYKYGRYSKICVHCNDRFDGTYAVIQRRKYCSLKCSAEHRREEDWLPKVKLIEAGNTQLSVNIETNNNIFRRYLIEKYGPKCMKCNWSEINTFTKRVPIELEHKDGDCTNNCLSNLELLCPNCHSLTSTYKGANKREGGSKRYQMWKEYFK